jgi:AraC-like DNA-binding protein
VLSVGAEREAIRASLLAGAAGYCVRRAGLAEVPDAVRAMVRHGRFLCGRSLEALISPGPRGSPPPGSAVTPERQQPEPPTGEALFQSALGPVAAGFNPPPKPPTGEALFQSLLRSFRAGRVEEACASALVAAGFSIASLARMCGRSRHRFEWEFHANMRRPAREVVHELRMRLAREELRAPLARIKEIAARMGYKTQNNFARAVKARFGRSPSGLRQKAGKRRRQGRKRRPRSTNE